MIDLMNAMMLWLSLLYGLPQTAEVPTLAYMPAERLAQLRYATPATGAEADVMAVYDDRTETIYLRPDWSEDSGIDLSILVHELVHHLQHVAGRTYRCPGEREQLAFTAQAEWLLQYGETLESAFGLDPVSLKLATMCLPY